MHYVDEGSGAPVVMLHGNPTWSFYYRNLILALRGSCRAIAPDHIGCGLSDKPPDGLYSYTLSRRVDDVESLLEQLGVTSGITLVLHDWGGMIGMAYAARRPQRVARLVLLNTAAFRLPAGKRLPLSLRLARAPGLGALLVRGLNLFARGAARACVKRKRLPPSVRAGYLAPYGSWSDRIAVHRFVEDIPVHPGDAAFDVLKQVESGLSAFREKPILVLWGERDFVFDASFLEEWRRRFPEAEIHRFADAGHYVLEDAFEEIVTLMKGFLLAHPLGTEVRR